MGRKLDQGSHSHKYIRACLPHSLMRVHVLVAPRAEVLTPRCATPGPAASQIGYYINNTHIKPIGFHEPNGPHTWEVMIPHYSSQHTQSSDGGYNISKYSITYFNGLYSFSCPLRITNPTLFLVLHVSFLSNRAPRREYTLSSQHKLQLRFHFPYGGEIGDGRWDKKRKRLTQNGISIQYYHLVKRPRKLFL